MTLAVAWKVVKTLQVHVKTMGVNENQGTESKRSEVYGSEKFLRM